MKTFKEMLKEKADNKGGTGDKQAYQTFLKKAIAKFGGKGVDFDSVPKDKRDELGDYIDTNWKSDDEEKGINEKSLSDSDVKNMLNTIINKTKAGSGNSSKDIYKMAMSMLKKSEDGLSPEQVGWAMKTMKVLSGK